MMMVRVRFLIGTAAVLASALSACGGKEDGNDGAGARVGVGGSGSTGSGSTSSGATGSGATGSGATGNAGGELPPGVCANDQDDDGDGLVDGFDPECTGPADNDEGTFATGIPGDNRDPKWQDCFFDGNSGAGDDQCRYHTDCLYGTRDADDPDCRLADACVDFCRPLTPNGCDCFGCCSVTGPGGENVDILLQPSCSLDNVGDAKACPRCTQAPSCENTCGRCELCPGKTEQDLPDDCTPDPPEPPPDGGTPPEPPPAYTCDGGQVCGDNLACPAGQYCQLGCCRVVVR